MPIKAPLREKNMKKIIKIFFLFFAATNMLAMEEVQTPEKESEENLGAPSFFSAFNWITLDEDNKEENDEDHAKFTQSNSCVYNYGKSQNIVSLCGDSRDDSGCHILSASGGLIAPFIFALGYLANLPGMFIPAAIVSVPCTPYFIHTCTGCLILESARKLDKREFVKEYENGLHEGFETSNFRRALNEKYYSCNKCLQTITNPCCGPSGQ
jgi:hypothetical protein